ncbi:MAG: sigma-70 family RNA polymerase sigma factor [Candidatus Acidiferrum sp.]|jgi:RNA polymerase sigma factor (TIGR02999 family)
MHRSSDRQSTGEVTELLKAWSGGEKAALEKLSPLVERELHRLAHQYMAREKPGHTLQTTALVNEVYLRLVNVPEVSWQDRAHFFAISARMMRRILTDFARSRKYLKRGGGAVQVSLDEALVVSSGRPRDIVALDDALSQLAVLYARQSQVVELRFYGGLGVEETAEVLKISPETVKRDWKFARAWLLHEMNGELRDGR